MAVQFRLTIYVLIFQITNVLCPFEILRRCTKKLYKNPFTLFFFHLSYFSHEPENRFWCLLHRLILKTLMNYTIGCWSILFWFRIITLWIPLFSPVRTHLYICKFTCYFVTRKYKKTLNFVTKKTFNEPSLTIHTKIVNTNGKFIVQFVRFRSRGAEFCTFLLEAIFIYCIFLYHNLAYNLA